MAGRKGREAIPAPAVAQRAIRTPPFDLRGAAARLEMDVVPRADRRHLGEVGRVILDAALHALERGSVDELTVRAVAKHGNLSERTIFRYFPTREDFLDGIADEVRAQLALPAPPATLEALLAAPRALYAAFEAKKSLTLAALHTELFHRMRETQAKLRWKAVGKLVDSLAPKKSERERRIATANIRYFLAASTWYYYRFYFGFSLEESIACAETAIRQSLSGLGVKA